MNEGIGCKKQKKKDSKMTTLEYYLPVPAFRLPLIRRRCLVERDQKHQKQQREPRDSNFFGIEYLSDECNSSEISA